MKIETDHAHIVSGVRHSQTIGSPIAILIENKDWKNWTEALPVEDRGGRKKNRKRSRGRGPVTRIWPERSNTIFTMRAIFWSAPAPAKRRRASRVGALAKAFLAEFGIGVLSHVIAVGEARLDGRRRGKNWWRSASATKCCWVASTPKPSSA